MRPQSFTGLLVPAFMAMGAMITTSCVGQPGPKSPGLRNCVEQEASADGRLTCIKGVKSAGDEPKQCSHRGKAGGSLQPLDDGRRDDIVKNARLLRYEEWNAVTNAPFEYDVDWGGSIVAAESKNASEWLRGALLGADASLQLVTGPDTRRLLELAIRPEVELIDDFVNGAPAKLLGEASSDLKKVEAMLGTLRTNTHAYFSGLYIGLDKANATKACYRDFAEAEVRMQQAVAKFEKKVKETREQLDARHKEKSAQEAQELKRDRETWAKAESDTCRAVKKATDCDGVEAYLAAFPAGERAEESTKILESVAATLSSLRDKAAWDAAGVTACRQPKTSTACDGVKAYVEKFPQGQKSEKARRMLRIRRDALEELAGLEKQRRRVAKARAKQECVNQCVKAMHKCQKQCKQEPAASLDSCNKTCMSTYNATCVPGC